MCPIVSTFFLILVAVSFIRVVRFISGVGGSDVFIRISTFRFFIAKKEKKEFLVCVGSEARSLLLPTLRGPPRDRCGAALPSLASTLVSAEDELWAFPWVPSGPSRLCLQLRMPHAHLPSPWR